jgi:diguanylate cyclase (GGDEF)-like protein
MKLVTGVEYLDEYHRSAATELGDLTQRAVPVPNADPMTDEHHANYTADQKTIDDLLLHALPDAHRRTWNELRSTHAFRGFAKLHADLVDDRPAASPQPESAALALLLGMGIERSEALVSFTETLGAALNADTAHIDARATADAAHLVDLVVLLALATLALTSLAVRSITRPLHRVLDVASSVAAGNLGSMDLPTAGPRELAKVVEVLGHNIAAIDAHARALAEGRLEDAALPVSLPGGIGSLLQLTMERLADETARLAHRARHDPLTGLLNRGAILDELALASRAGRRTDGAVVAFVDLDGFKAVNDEHGHDLGDELLVAVADRLRVIPSAATSVGRLGGDEFVAVCRYPSNSNELAKQLLGCFDEPFVLSTGPLSLKASIGVAHCPPGSDPLEGLRRADQATYAAKRRGKAQLVVA